MDQVFFVGSLNKKQVQKSNGILFQRIRKTLLVFRVSKTEPELTRFDPIKSAHISCETAHIKHPLPPSDELHIVLHPPEYLAHSPRVGLQVPSHEQAKVKVTRMKMFPWIEKKHGKQEKTKTSKEFARLRTDYD